MVAQNTRFCYFWLQTALGNDEDTRCNRNILQTQFLLFVKKFLVYIHAGNSKVPPRVLACGPKLYGGNKVGCFSTHLISTNYNQIKGRIYLL